jgi:hypothetical protein
MKSPGFYNFFKFMFFWERRFGAVGVGARPQNFGRLCRRPQALPSGILLAASGDALIPGDRALTSPGSGACHASHKRGMSWTRFGPSPYLLLPPHQPLLLLPFAVSSYSPVLTTAPPLFSYAPPPRATGARPISALPTSSPGLLLLVPCWTSRCTHHFFLTSICSPAGGGDDSGVRCYHGGRVLLQLATGLATIGDRRCYHGDWRCYHGDRRCYNGDEHCYHWRPVLLQGGRRPCYNY